jgi:hypothetical protein
MKAGQGPNWGCSAKEKNHDKYYFLPDFGALEEKDVADQ